MQNPRGLALAYTILLFVFIYFAYSNAHHSPFIFDDLANIVVNPLVQPESLEDLPRALDRSEFLSYRPLASLSFAINYLYGGFDVHGYHLTNILIHAINALLLFSLIQLLYTAFLSGKQSGVTDTEFSRQTLRVAFWGAILWAVNPVQVQVVTYIVQRMTSLATMFYLLAMILFVLRQQGRLSAFASYSGIAICFCLGLLCKEIISTLPLALLLLKYLLMKEGEKPDKRLLLVCLGMIPALGLYYLAGRFPDITSTYPDRDFSGIERLMSQPRVLWHYLSVWFMPMPERLKFDYEVLVSRSLWQPVTTLPALLGLLLAAVLAWRIRKRYPFIALGVLFFLLASSLEASFLNLEMAFIHRLYLPSVFLMVGCLSVLPARQIDRFALVLWLVVGLLTLGTIERNKEWNNRAEFWKVDYQRGASPARAILNHAIGLLETSRFEEAERQLGAFLPEQHGKEHLKIVLATGIAQYHQGRYEDAIATLEQPGMNPLVIQEVQYYKGSAYARLGKLDELREVYLELLELNVDGPYGHLLQAEYQRGTGDITGALQTVKSYMENHHLSLSVLNNFRLYLADIYLELKKPEQAYAIYNEIVEKDPEQFLAWVQIYRMLRSSGDTENLNKVRAYLESRHVRLPED